MSLTPADVKKIAHLARLTLSEADLALYTPQLSHILEFVEQMNQMDTKSLEPLAHPLETNLRLRSDEITETNQRDAFQAIAPLVEAGLYLVPKVIEGE
jgi:aspartyl-tRNA(Asn)/glutamyl-tRNA(Gln) amidotransferase subunit C